MIENAETNTKDIEKNVLIVRYGEVALKGNNKPYFEKMLIARIRRLLKQFSGVNVYRHEGLIYIKYDTSNDTDKLIKKTSQIFGVDTISPAKEIIFGEGPNTPEEILSLLGDAAIAYMKNLIDTEGVQTFKVHAKRADKSFKIKSPDISRKIGAAVLKGCGVLKVDVHSPDVMLHIDVRKKVAYIYHEKIKGFGGLPLGTNGKGMILLSGGIDSPVAAFMMAKRGMMIEAVHFHSYPYTSERALEKVKELATILSSYFGGFKMHIVNLLPIQEEIAQKCPEGEMTILVRRAMMKIGEKVAKESECEMLITGENLGQVASQTAESLVVTDQSVEMPVMRPLIALDKTDIMDIAKEIDTYKTSIQPYEDCCTVFLPKHPVTKPSLEKILASESKYDLNGMSDTLLNSIETVEIKPD